MKGHLELKNAVSEETASVYVEKVLFKSNGNILHPIGGGVPEIKA